MDGKLHPKGTESVNPQFHDEFVALVALFYSGELTDEEWSLLQVHLAYCDTCRTTFEQYKYIASDVIPAMAASAAAEDGSLPRESARDIAEAEQRLMDKLGSAPFQKPKPVPQRPLWQTLTGAIAACALVALAFAGVHLIRQPSKSPVPSGSPVPYNVPST